MQCILVFIWQSELCHLCTYMFDCLSVVILLKQCSCDVRQNQQINQPILINFIILWLMCMYSLLPAWLCFFAFIYFCHLGGQWIFEIMGLKNSSCIYFTIRIYSMKYSVFHNDVCKNQIKWQNEELGSIYKLFYTDFTPPRSLTSADHQRLSICRNIQWFIYVSQSKSSRKIEQRGRIFTFNWERHALVYEDLSAPLVYLYITRTN
jgi:hypothetical protein